MSVTLGVPPSQATKLLQAQEEKDKKDQETPVAAPQPPTHEVKIVKEYPDDLKSLIEKARKEEKDKLYDRIRRAEAIESESQTLKSRVQDLEKSNADFGRQVEETGKKKSKKNEDSEDLDLSALIKDTAAAVTKQLEEKYAQERKSFSEQISALQARITGNDLASIRERLIAEAGGKIIAAMVRGNTEDEVRQSVLEAKAEYEKIARSVSGHSSVSAASTTASAPSPRVPSAGEHQPAAPTPVARGELTSQGADGVPALNEGQRLADDVRGMSREDYRKHRASILGRMKKLYPKGSVNPMVR